MDVDFIPGVKVGIAVAGFAGGVASLSYLKPLSKTLAFASVITGALFATYVTPLFTDWFKLGPAAEHGSAFLLGLTAMNLIPLALGVSAYLRDHPGEIARKFLPKDEGPKA